MSQAMYKDLASIGYRIFALRIERGEYKFWVGKKTTQEWREDVCKFRDSSKRSCEDGWADDKVHNDLYKHLRGLGYEEVEDVVADVFEGRIANNSCSLVDDPDHDDIQADGFGHFGWDKGGWNKKEGENES